MVHCPLLSGRLVFSAVAALAASAFAADKPDAFPPMPPVQGRTAQEELKTIQLPPGYRLQLVVSEPEVKEPAMIVFDGNGRMFVAELNTYMQDANGTDELTPKSRVSLHWSSKGDGVYDKHTTFADGLLLPRMMLPLDKGQLVICETNTNALYLYTDTNGDGVSDKKEMWLAGDARGGNLEHQPNGLLWCLDNWLYSTYNAYRLRWTPKGILREPTAPNGGQWGIAQDDFGKVWFSNAGGERGPLNYQTPIVYGAFNVPEQSPKGFAEVWPLVGMADVQGGTSRFRPEDGTVNHFTGTCGQQIFRDDRLPAELRGDFFIGEPVGRLIRRAKVEVKDAVTYLSNPHEKSEFIRSTDPCFRPINIATAPDGTLFIVDMYRGIIQEGNWTRPGSYLRKVMDQYQFEKVIGRGRIWRLVHDTTKLDAAPRMLDEKPAQLVSRLAHPNGWWRDTAQQLLVLRQDPSVVPALTEMARADKYFLARLHALWTLEGLDALTPALVREKLKDAHPQLRAAAIRVSESLYKKGDKSLVPDVQAMARDADASVPLQAMLTAKLLDFPDWKKSVTELANAASTAPAGLKAISELVLAPPAAVAAAKMSPAEEKLFKAGETAFQTLCATCHGTDAKGTPMTGAAPGTMLAPALAGSKTMTGWKDGSIKVMLHGLTGDIDGKKYEGQMIPMANNDDA